MLHSKIIDDLAERIGTQQKLAGRLGVDDSRLSKWKLVGIPSRHWPALLRIAKRKGMRLTLDQIEAASPLRSTAKTSRAA
jgi:DNA-binding transcriptional regulator YdaS (Cro superfamily)